MPTYDKEPYENFVAISGTTRTLIATGIAAPGIEIDYVNLQPTGAVVESKIKWEVSNDGGTTFFEVGSHKLKTRQAPTDENPNAPELWRPTFPIPLNGTDFKLYATFADAQTAIHLMIVGRKLTY